MELVKQIEHLKERAVVLEAKAAEEIDRAQQAVAERAQIEDASVQEVCKPRVLQALGLLHCMQCVHTDVLCCADRTTSQSAGSCALGVL
jgi:hypothetical protein